MISPSVGKRAAVRWCGWLLLFCVGLSSLGRQAAAERCLNLGFNNSSSPYVTLGPGKIVVADFNLDGKDDLAIADLDDNPLVVKLGNGTGGFINGPAASVSVGSPGTIAVGDFNNDGKPDLVAAYSTTLLSILWGDGTGKFTETPNSAADTTTIPVNLLVTDLNGDNLLDVAFTDRAGKLEVQLRTPAGSASLFAPASGSPISLSSGTNLNKFAAPLDFNNDGKRDLVVTSTNGVEFLQGQGTGAFTRLAAVGAADTRAIVTGDFNGDGRTDIAVAGRYVGGTITGVAIMLNDGAGGYTVKLVQTADLAIDLVLRDFDNDGVPDLGTLIFTQAESQIHILRGIGDGTFTILGPYAASAADGWSYSFAAGEFNQDGKPDFVSGDYWNGTMHIWLNTCTPNTPPTITLLAGVTRPQATGAARLNLATVSDVEFAAGTLTVSASNLPTGISLTNFTNTNGTISAEVAATCNAALGNHAVTLTVTDGGGARATTNLNVNVTTALPVTLGSSLNPSVAQGDSVTITPNAAPSGAVFFSVSAQGFFGNLTINQATGAVTVSGAGPLGSYPVLVRATGNCNTAAAVRAFLLTVTGSGCALPLYASATGSPLSAGSSTADEVRGDFNQDGKADLVAANAVSNNVSVWLGNGNGTFGAKADYAVGTSPRAVATGDFNQDGKTDLLVGNYTGGTLSLLPGNGDGTFGAKSDVTGYTGVQALSVSDYNSDGKLDVVAALAADSQVMLVMGNGDGTFGAPTSVYTGSDPVFLANTDLNQDNRIDVLIANKTSGRIGVLFNITGTGTSGLTFFSTDLPVTLQNPTAVTSGDFNGDSKRDIAVAATGKIAIVVELPVISGLYVLANERLMATPDTVTATDLNGDGKPDLVTANANGTASLLLSNGDTTFTALPESAIGSGLHRLTLGDFNGDSRADFAVSNLTTNNVNVILSGSCNIAPPITAAAAVTREQGFAAANATIATVSDDLTAAGALTVTATTIPTGLSVTNIINTNGTITADVAAGCNAVVGANNVALRVTDGNGATATANFVVNVTANTPPTLAYQATPHVVYLGDSAAIVPTQLASDTNPTQLSVAVLSKGTYTGTIRATPGGGGRFSLSNIAPVGTHVITVRATDSCGTTTDASFTVTVLGAATSGNYPNATVALGGSVTVTPDAAPTAATETAAFASPTFQGLLTVNRSTGVVRVTNAQPAGTHTVRVNVWNPAGEVSKTFSLTVNPATVCVSPTFASAGEASVGAGSGALALVDFNNDGKLDYVTANAGANTVSIRLGNGAGGFLGTTEVAVGTAPSGLALADFNSDGKLDFITANKNSNNVSLRLGDGLGGFSNGPDTALTGSPGCAVSGDFNGDSVFDFAAPLPNNNTILSLGETVNGFTFTAYANTAAVSPKAVVAGDFNSVNSGGKAQIIVAHATTGALTLVQMEPGFIVTTRAVGNVSAAALTLTTGDFNGDGKLDLASVNAANRVSIRLGDGLGSFTGATELSFAGQTLRAATTGDFNGDGKLDLAVAATNNVLIRFGDGLGGFTNGPSVALTGDWTSIVTGDFNGDGKLDFALANPTTNKVNILLASCNLIPPSITASPTLTRQQGSAAANAVLATVSDDRTAAGALTVTATTIPAGLTVVNLVNTNGTITAEVAAACNATVGTNNLVLQVTDGDSLTATAILVVNVTANTPPALDYPTLATGFANLALNLPAIPPPTDNGSVASIAVLSKGTYTGGIAVNAAGVVAFTNIAPIGLHTITMRATDNCGATRDVSFSFNVVCVPLTITTPPQPHTVSANANASFSVIAHGVGLSYQWRKGGVALTNSTNLSGAQTATLTLTAVTAASAGSYDVVVTSACNAVTSTSATLTVSNTPAPLLVNEFRFSGPNGVDDWYVELYNNTAQPISTTGLKLNWVNAIGNQTGFVALTPNRTIQPRGYYLIAGAEYSFTFVPADDTAPASAITGWLLGGVLLCDAANAVFDAVGTTDLQRSGQTQFSEGTPVAALGAPAVQHAWVRKSATNGGAPQDTNNNQNDFALVATWAVTLNGVMLKLGAPGPQNLAAPPLNNLGLPVTLLNPANSASSGPNTIVENVATTWGETVFSRSLYLRRTITNNTGKPVTRLRFRITEISNGGVNTAILRALSSSDITVNGQLVKGLTLETPPSQPNGGGLNSALSAGSITLTAPLAVGAKINVQFCLGIVQGGSYRFYANVEAAN